MSETAEHKNRASPDHWTHRLARRVGLAAVVLCCWAGATAAEDVQKDATAPIRIAVFPFELEDFSAAREQGSSPDMSIYLTQSTEEARKQLVQSGRYAVVDTADADIGAAKEHGLRNCGGCEAAIAKKLGAEQALIGVVTKISMTEYNVRVQVSDVQSGAVVSRLATNLRMGTGDSWFRGVRSLMKNRMLAAK